MAQSSPDSPHERLAWARERAGYASKAAFADAVGVPQVTYRAYENGQNGFSKLAAQFARKLGVSAEWLLEGGPLPGTMPPPVAEQPSAISVDAGETAPVLRLDLSYSMGPGTDLDGSYIDAEAFQFDLGFLRSMTITPADRLRIVDGIGDSMQPTLHDRDLIFVDVNQNTLNAQDRIWAIWLFGLGAVKRLRALDADKVLIISDNPDVENQVVNRVDITIHGRVVGSIKRH